MGDAIREWRASAAYRRMAGVFAGGGADDPAPVAGRAAALLEDGGWAAELLAPLVATLADDPLFEPPFKVQRDASRVAAVLFQCPSGSITATVARAAASPTRLVFSGRMTVTRVVRSGGATLRRWRLGAADAPCRALPPRVLVDGEVYRVDGRQEATLVGEAQRDVVTLTASIAAGALPLMREHAVADGALLRIAHADDRPSRIEMLLAMLRASGRSDLAPCFAAATHDADHAVRWAAMREWLALDAQAALPRLAAMAAHDGHAEVRAAAAATLPRVEARCRG